MPFPSLLRKSAACPAGGGTGGCASIAPDVPVGVLALLYACLFFELGINLPFFPLWLKAQSLDSDAIGIVLAAPLLTRIVANPAIGALADRSGRVAMVLMLCATLVAAGTGILTVASGFWPILFVVIVIAVGQGPLIALADTLVLGRLARAVRSELTYGRIRLWGSLGFAAANLVAGWALEWFSAAAIIVLLLASTLATAAAAAGCLRATPHPAAEDRHGDRWPVHPLFLACAIVGAALVQASHAAFYGFGALHWQAAGMSGPTMGGLWSLGVLSEVVLFAFLGYRLNGPGSATGLLAAAAVTTVLRWAVMARDPDLPALICLQLTHGVTFGVTHLASIFLVARLAPGRMQASVQAWLAASWAGLMAVLTTLSGWLYESWGERIYLVMAAAAGIGLLVMTPVAWSLWRSATGMPASQEMR